MKRILLIGILLFVGCNQSIIQEYIDMGNANWECQEYERLDIIMYNVTCKWCGTYYEYCYEEQYQNRANRCGGESHLGERIIDSKPYIIQTNGNCLKSLLVKRGEK